MSAASRHAILARLRRAQMTGRIPGFGSERRRATTSGTPAIAPERPAIPPRREEVLRRFLEELALLGVEYHVEASPTDVRTRVISILGNRTVFRWDTRYLPYDIGLILEGTIDGRSPRERQAAAEIGLTGCDAAIAETGSLVLLSGEGKPRAASLLPPVHLAVMRRNDLRFSMGDIFIERADAIAASACCTVITGPSRTADIELTLTLGVHGPGELIVVVGP
jgi:L-lactate dehydrogenase complex protein LldG